MWSVLEARRKEGEAAIEERWSEKNTLLGEKWSEKFAEAMRKLMECENERTAICARVTALEAREMDGDLPSWTRCDGVIISVSPAFLRLIGIPAGIPHSKDWVLKRFEDLASAGKISEQFVSAIPEMDRRAASHQMCVRSGIEITSDLKVTLVKRASTSGQGEVICIGYVFPEDD